MPLPTPSLDDRHFQDIVDQAKLLIPQYCREWTDHNVSDPGVTLIELFAWMTDMLLYRVNQVPDKNYISFLEMIGVRLEEPRAATAPVTFYLSVAQPTDITIPVNTEVATVRTETNPAIIFTTEADLTIRTPTLLDTFTRNASRDSKEPWLRHNSMVPHSDSGKPPSSRQAGRTSIFPAKPGSGDAFILALGKDHSHHILALTIACDRAGGAGVDPDHPPIEWQVWQGRATRWVPCELEYDGTRGFNESGEIILYIPRMEQAEFQGQKAYWLRCLATDPKTETGSYKVSPIVQQLRIEARGGTVNARHAITVRNETLGTSDGTPGQSFQLLHSPILALDPTQDQLLVQSPSGKNQRWQEVTDFGDSGAEDAHFTLDKLDGTITLGPALLQPDGMMYRFGRVPEKSSLLSFSRYQYGGGVIGNVAQGTLSVLKSSIPYVARIINRGRAVGGRDAQSLADARLRAPQTLRTRTRAVTADDYEYLAGQVPGVARARCIAPGAQPGERSDPRPGQVFVIVLPQADAPQERIPAERLVLSAELRSAVLAHLDERRLLGSALEVRQPQYLWISVQAKLHVPERSDPTLIRDVQLQAEEALYRYLNPYVGGPHRNGWPFGRALNRSEIYGLLQSIESVEYVEDVQISVSESSSGADPKPAAARAVALPRHGLICSDQHQVKVS